MRVNELKQRPWKRLESFLFSAENQISDLDYEKAKHIQLEEQKEN